MTVPAVMLQGTGSDVGKSLLVAGLGRAYTRQGLEVRPFKPQNMSNNAAVTADGGEIGRAQALQARACRVAPSRHMNPVLLKPESAAGAQVVVQGRLRGSVRADAYPALKPDLMPEVLESFARLGAEADLVLVEGAGSPAEINLRPGDIANMGFAQAAHVPVVLVGDIARGGVIAQIVGTWHLLEAGEQALLKGFIINKFHGDASLFDGGLAAIRERTGLASLGVVPYFAAAARLPAEDAVALDDYAARAAGAIRIAVPQLSRIANFDDLDPLRAEADVRLELVRPGQAIPGDADLVLLPGTKATLADLAFLKAQGWDIDILAHHRRGGRVLGICGGFQMLGRTIRDPDGIEGAPGEAAGLGLLDFETVLTGDKLLVETVGVDAETGAPVAGYHMHVGRSTGSAFANPMLRLDGTGEGARSADGRAAGCYLHGLFASDAYRHAFLGGLRTRCASAMGYEAQLEETLDALADHLGRYLDLAALLEIAQGRGAARTPAR